MTPSSDPLLQKIIRYAAYQERCSRDVEMKLRAWKVPEGLARKLTGRLREEGYLDDERFARAYVRGKFRVNRWGKVRIAGELKARGIPDVLIARAIEEIGDEEYEETIRDLIQKKTMQINPENSLNNRKKMFNFVVGKGYEPQLVLQILESFD